MNPLKPYQLKAEAKVKKFTDQLINSRKGSRIELGAFTFSEGLKK